LNCEKVNIGEDAARLLLLERLSSFLFLIAITTLLNIRLRNIPGENKKDVP